jgi:hypothetical protein
MSKHVSRKSSPKLRLRRVRVAGVDRLRGARFFCAVHFQAGSRQQLCRDRDERHRIVAGEAEVIDIPCVSHIALRELGGHGLIKRSGEDQIGKERTGGCSFAESSSNGRQSRDQAGNVAAKMLFPPQHLVDEAKGHGRKEGLDVVGDDLALARVRQGIGHR